MPYVAGIPGTLAAGTLGSGTLGNFLMPAEEVAARSRVYAVVAVARPSGVHGEGAGVNQLSTSPSGVDMASPETIPFSVDMAAVLMSGETVSSPLCTLEDLSTGADVSSVSLAGTPSVVGTRVQQTITALEDGHWYRYVVTFTAMSGKIVSTETLIRCVF